MKCPYCFQEYSAENRARIILDRRIANALASTEKRKSKGKKPGPHTRINKNRVLELRKNRLTLRAIAKEVGCSFHRVNQILKECK